MFVKTSMRVSLLFDLNCSRSNSERVRSRPKKTKENTQNATAAIRKFGKIVCSAKENTRVDWETKKTLKKTRENVHQD